MSQAQPGILQPVPDHARYLVFSHQLDIDPVPSLRRLQAIADGNNMVVGLGYSLLRQLGTEIKGMGEMPVFSGVALEVPSTPASLWVWLRGEDRGDLVHLTIRVKGCLSDAFEISSAVDGYRHRDSRDLSGYEDGTENPEGDEALKAALVDSDVPGLGGSSFVVAMQWVHNLEHFKSLPQSEQDNIIGRRIKDNEEFEEAPESAHVKRSAQESFQPEAFMLRRSMPWNDAMNEGLEFVAFGHSFLAFESIMHRMVGLEDGITDGLFRFSQPVSGAYFWCPPVKEGQLDLSLIKQM